MTHRRVNVGQRFLFSKITHFPRQRNRSKQRQGGSLKAKTNFWSRILGEISIFGVLLIELWNKLRPQHRQATRRPEKEPFYPRFVVDQIDATAINATTENQNFPIYGFCVSQGTSINDVHKILELLRTSLQSLPICPQNLPGNLRYFMTLYL